MGKRKLLNFIPEISETHKYKSGLKKANKKHEPTNVIYACLIVIFNYHMIEQHIDNLNGIRDGYHQNLLRHYKHKLKFYENIMFRIDEHNNIYGKYHNCREFHPYRLESYGHKYDKLVILYKTLIGNNGKLIIKLMRIGNHDF